MIILTKEGSKNTAALWLMLAILFVSFFLPLFSNSAFAETTIVICNKDISESSLDKANIIKVFLGKKTEWNDGQKIHFAVMKKSETHKAFLSQYIGKTSSQFRNYWRKRVFTGKGRAPQKMDSVETMIKFVKETSGAIGYIPANAFNDSVKKLSE